MISNTAGRPFTCGWRSPHAGHRRRREQRRADHPPQNRPVAASGGVGRGGADRGQAPAPRRGTRPASRRSPRSAPVELRDQPGAHQRHHAPPRPQEENGDQDPRPVRPTHQHGEGDGLESEHPGGQGDRRETPAEDGRHHPRAHLRRPDQAGRPGRERGAVPALGQVGDQVDPDRDRGERFQEERHGQPLEGRIAQRVARRHVGGVGFNHRGVGDRAGSGAVRE